MRKLAILFVLMIFVLVGCSSTNPALTEVIWKNYESAFEPFESQNQIKLSTNLPDVLGEQTIPEEYHVLFDALRSGINLNVKQKDPLNSYINISLEDPSVLDHITDDLSDPQFDAYIVDGKTYFKTTTEDQFIAGDEAISISAEEQELAFELLQQVVKPYLEQYDFDLKNVKFLGRKSVDTPGGSQTLNHIQVQFDVEELKNMLSYTLGNIADYKQLGEAIQMATSHTSGEENTLTEEELEANIYMMRGMLKAFQAEVDSYTISEWEEEIGLRFNLTGTVDVYVTNSGDSIKQNLNLNLALEPMEDMFNDLGLEETLKFDLALESVKWNMGQDISYDLPDFNESYNLMSITTDYRALQSMNEGSLIRQYINEYILTRSGWFDLNSTEAWINGDWVELDASPYVKNGNTLVPVKYISDLSYGNVVWNGDTKEVTYTLDDTTVTVQIGNTTAVVNGQEVEMPIAPEIVNSRTFVPLRFISENLGAEVEWYAETKEIFIEF